MFAKAYVVSAVVRSEPDAPFVSELIGWAGENIVLDAPFSDSTYFEIIARGDNFES